MGLAATRTWGDANGIFAGGSYPIGRGKPGLDYVVAGRGCVCRHLDQSLGISRNAAKYGATAHSSNEVSQLGAASPWCLDRQGICELEHLVASQFEIDG